MQTENDQPLKGAWLIVAILWVVGCLNYLDRVMIITMRSSIKAAIPMTEAEFGLLTTSFLLMYGILSPFGGFIADRFSRSRVILFSLLAWSATTWLTAHATTFTELVISRVIMGVSEACYFPAAGALIADYHRNKTRSLANGIHLSGVMVGSGLGGIGGYLADGYGWQFAFSLFGAIGILFAGVLVAFMRDAPVTATSAATFAPANPPAKLLPALRSLMSERAYVLALVFWAMLGLSAWGFIGWMPTYLGEHFHLSQGKAGFLATGCVYSGSLVGMVVSGAWADYWSRRQTRARIWVAVIGLILTIPIMMIVAHCDALMLATVGLVIYGLTRSFAESNMNPILCQITDVRYRATGIGLLNSLGAFVAGGTIYAGGMLRDAHIDIVRIFEVGAAGMVVCIVLMWLIKPKVVA